MACGAVEGHSTRRQAGWPGGSQIAACGNVVLRVGCQIAVGLRRAAAPAASMLRQAPTRYPLRQHVRDVIESKVFSAAMLTIIFVNTFLIALQTDQMAQMKADWYLSVVDNVFLGIYILELILSRSIAAKLTHFQKIAFQ